MLNKLNLEQIFTKIAADRKKMIIFICVTLLVMYVDYAFLLTPQFSIRKDLSSKLKAIRTNLDNFSKDVKRIKGLNSKNGKALGSVQTQAFISQDQVPFLLQHISNMANNYDIKILQIKPSKAKDEKKQVSYPEAKDFTAFSIAMEVIADYNQLTKFLESMEKGNIFVSIENLKITPQDGDILKQKVSLGIRTYVRK